MVERNNCEWFTGDLGELKHHLHALERKYKASGLAIDKEIYGTKSGEYEQCHASTKQLYYMSAVLECSGEQGAMFNNIKYGNWATRQAPLYLVPDNKYCLNETKLISCWIGLGLHHYFHMIQMWRWQMTSPCFLITRL